mgnify:CR=1 FL=1
MSGTEPRAAWLINLEERVANGTHDRLSAIVESRTPVQIKRTSGEMATGYVIENAGVVVQVAWGNGAETWWREGGGYRVPPGVMSKTVPTEDFLEWNPAIAGEEQP